MSQSTRIMIMAGGTGGHIFPGLAVAEVLCRRGASVQWLGTPNGLENRLVPAAGLPMDVIRIAGLRGKGLAGWLLAPLRIVRAMFQAREILKKRQPDCVLSMGGYVAGPGGLMARLMGIPLVIHEQNAVAGLTNRLLAPLARRIMTGFPGTFRHGEHCGNPVRSDITALPAPEQRMAGRQGPLRLLVVGGSQGAAVFGRVLPQALARMASEARPQVRHQAGRQVEDTVQAYRAAGIDVEVEVIEFIDDMASAWGEADLALCRSGALTVAELAAAGVPAVLVPYAHAVDDHQSANARHLVEGDAAWLIAESELSAQTLAERLASVDRPQLVGMAMRARELARPGAAEKLAMACLEVCS